MNDFDEIYSMYCSSVYKYMLLLCNDKHTAEEITQETFFKAMKNIHKFKGDCKLSVWLCQIAKNTYFTTYKKEKKLTKKEMSNYESDAYDVEKKLVDDESSILIHKVLHKLKEPYKEVFSLRVFSELSFASIGGIFDKSEGWARITFHRAKLKIREDINEK